MNLKEELFRKLRSSTALQILDTNNKEEMVALLKQKLNWWEEQ
jgi:hypothetical protein